MFWGEGGGGERERGGRGERKGREGRERGERERERGRGNSLSLIHRHLTFPHSHTRSAPYIKVKQQILVYTIQVHPVRVPAEYLSQSLYCREELLGQERWGHLLEEYAHSGWTLAEEERLPGWYVIRPTWLLTGGQRQRHLASL